MEMEEEHIQSLWGNRKDYCPDKDDRLIIKKDWTCDEYFAFNSYELLYQVSGVACKGF